MFHASSRQRNPEAHVRDASPGLLRGVGAPSRRGEYYHEPFLAAGTWTLPVIRRRWVSIGQWL